MTNEKLEKNCAQHALCALRRLTAGALLGSALLGGAVSAAPIPFDNRQVDMTAREQPIASFLQDFFSSMNIPVSVSSSVQGAINGTFQGTADEVFGKIERAFGLMAYYDGSVVYVYTPSDVSTRVFPSPVGGPAAVVSMARDMQLIDARNTLRVNRNGGLIASGSKRFIDMVGELAAGQQNQAGGAPMGFKVYYLNYAWAQDVSATYDGDRTTVVPGVATILRELLTSQRDSQTPALIQHRGTGEQSLRNQGLERQTQNQNQNSTLGAQGANPALPSASTVQQAWNNRPGGVQGTSIDAQLDSLNAAASMASDARVEADARLNAVIVRDSPARLPYYDQLIKALDVEPQALEIEATIIDLSSTKLRQLGINWNLAGDRYSFLFGNGTNTDNLLSTPTPVRNITPTGEGGTLSLVLGGNINNFAARINALQDEGVARIVTSPQVMTLSNVEAVFDNNHSFYVRVAGRQEVDLFKVSAGTTLRITPHVFREGSDVRIKLLVQIEDGAINSSNTVDQIPEVDRSSINTQALLMAGESLLIGGMVQDQEQKDVTKIPVLGDVPVLGNLFKYRSGNHDYTERLFLITPRLIPARRTLANPAPIGPQRPGKAVEPPPMPEFSDQKHSSSDEASQSSDKPAATNATGGNVPAGASNPEFSDQKRLSTNEAPKSSDKPAASAVSNTSAAGGNVPAGTSNPGLSDQKRPSTNDAPKSSNKPAASTVSNTPAAGGNVPAGASNPGLSDQKRSSTNEAPKSPDKPAASTVSNMPAAGGNVPAGAYNPGLSDQKQSNTNNAPKSSDKPVAPAMSNMPAVGGNVPAGAYNPEPLDQKRSNTNDAPKSPDKSAAPATSNNMPAGGNMPVGASN